MQPEFVVKAKGDSMKGIGIEEGDVLQVVTDVQAMDGDTVLVWLDGDYTIKTYCEENSIERQADMRVRTVAKKSMLKVKIIQSIDRQVALDDIAAAQGIEFDALLDEIEAIVYSGTKLNIDYFLEDVMDEDHIDDIYDYFSESDTDKLSIAQKELGGEYSEDEIRLVRIKFLSEMAN